MRGPWPTGGGAAVPKTNKQSKTTSKTEGKAVPVHAMKAYGKSRGNAPLILRLDTRWEVSG